ncbi:glycoside hydrolase family 3 N-terminal domain-containing protein [Roseivirga pacifica]|uniref:glycoside hydrolase family 3 N-terminal domain-containing protein n=1 Tax=Roseivirga pacifica TaxID=1267423 RepID=UPI002094B437|nr:glycoside hydrolase family 3 N-terminal domain-containing protein [Roseivirga pacifica]MCO6357105.1 glycoside hydrolase family 3 [Roseivirga pacifica]MCO6368182.1 glycoside hydrolase family 3 [Roseivirga pacifica]MCO6369337.1 glycoside hydrolase family 3 [Roseivirga pacifica]MCO6373191.1 glycoside hydrolase family 3 [Roseivirga pacifica]MCO6377552.1 glycoside hydrolase family 3 [Roseivirga pacifica]
MKKLTLLVCSIFCLSASLFGQEYPYQNPEKSVEERVKDLLSRMTLEEKVRQMDMYNGANLKVNEQFSLDRAIELIGDSLGAGAVHDYYPKTAKAVNDLQRYIIEHNRWGIPALMMCEFLHGYTGEGNTAFPMSIGLGATWDKDLMKQIGQVIAAEGRAHGIHFGLGPNLDLGREPRWGRIAETLGEDTHLSASLGTHLIQGIQGNDLKANNTMVAEPKHFAAHGSPQAGGNAGPVLLGERSVRTEYLPVFEQAFKEGGALGTMAAYSEIDGVPMASNYHLLTEVLREEWRFKGIVVSDLGAIRFLETSHHSTGSHKESIKAAVEAGIDMQFYDFPNEEYQHELVQMVKHGEMDEAVIDRAAGGVLRLKFMLGLFENPFTTQQLIDSKKHAAAHQQVALEAALKSMVLLKNEGGLLPLDKSTKKVAVLGPLANESLLGGYSVKEKKAITVYEGVKQYLGESAEVTYAEGVPLIYKGQAIPSVNLVLPDKSGNGLQASFYNNRNLSGEPVLQRVDEQVDFEWETSPGEGVNADHFSIRWEGYLVPDETFEGWVGVSSDDGVRLSVDDVMVIDNWQKGATNIETSPMLFEAGKEYKITLDMWEGGYGAKAYLLWNKEAPDFSEAVSLAKNADVAIVVVGESNELVEENKDVASLDLYGLQQEFIDEILKTGTPVVAVLMNGRPLSINGLAQKVPAVLEAWFPGEKGGLAVAQTLFGAYNPAGRLPVTFPRSVGQVPMYYSAKPTRNHRYVDEKITPLYPFGYGLSYASFAYSDLEVSHIGYGQVAVQVKVTNTSTVDGEEVVQLYVRDLVSSVTTPIKALKAFERVEIPAGETKTIYFSIKPKDLALWNRAMEQVVEAGVFRVQVGGSSTEGLTQEFEIKRAIELSKGN